MFVCICRSVTDHQIRDAVSGGASSMDDLQQGLGVATCCGRCDQCARGILNRALDECCSAGDSALQVA